MLSKRYDTLFGKTDHWAGNKPTLPVMPNEKQGR